MSDEISLVTLRGEAVGSDLVPAGMVAGQWRRPARLQVVAQRESAAQDLRAGTGARRQDAAPHLSLVAPECAADGMPRSEPGTHMLHDRAKRVVDLCCASLLLLAFAPLMLLVATLIRFSGAPVLFRQQRVGRDGRAFRLFKFRTMVPDAEARLEAVLRADPTLRAEWESNQKLRNDPRITPLGAFLRRTSIDELPQLLNVLHGEMSMVGPRPVLDAELERYGADRLWYTSVRPGVTGLWQVSGRNSTCYARRVALDIEYVRSRSARLDAFILLKTVYVVLFRVGAH